MKKKICLAALLVALLVLLVLIDSAGANGAEESLKEMVDASNKLCDFWKNQNKRISTVLDKILNILELEKGSYRWQQVKKLKNVIRETEVLLKESEEMLKGVLNEKNKETLLENICKIGDNLDQVKFKQRSLLTDLAIIFGHQPYWSPRREVIT